MMVYGKESEGECMNKEGLSESMIFFYLHFHYLQSSFIHFFHTIKYIIFQQSIIIDPHHSSSLPILPLLFPNSSTPI